jgi:anaerobic ribonucleoside-triphosphate reductase
MIAYLAIFRYDDLDERGGNVKAIYDKNKQVQYLKERLEIFLEVLEAIDEETADLEDIDRLIQMIDDIEEKLEQFKHRYEEE